MEENRIVWEPGSAADAVNNPNEEDADPAFRILLANADLTRHISSFRPGDDLDYFRNPENRLQIFRRGLIEVLQLLNITTFTREEVFVTIRADQTACLNYMFRIHPTMIRDHATTYTSYEIIIQLRTNENAGVLRHMHRLDPTMFENINFRSDVYRHLRFGHDASRHGPGSLTPLTATFNFIERFKLVTRLLNMTTFTFDDLYTSMLANHHELIYLMFNIQPTIVRDLGKRRFLTALAGDGISARTVVAILQNVRRAGNQLPGFDLIPDDLNELMAFQRLLRKYANSRWIVDFINRHLVTDEMFPRLVLKYIRDYDFDERSRDYVRQFIGRLLSPRYDDDGEWVGEGNLDRFNQVLSALTPVTPALERMLLDLSLYDTDNPDVIRRLRDQAALRGRAASASDAAASASDARFFLFSYA
jgi:hypothetical protein